MLCLAQATKKEIFLQEKLAGSLRFLSMFQHRHIDYAVISQDTETGRDLLDHQSPFLEQA